MTTNPYSDPPERCQRMVEVPGRPAEQCRHQANVYHAFTNDGGKPVIYALCNEHRLEKPE